MISDVARALCCGVAAGVRVLGRERGRKYQCAGVLQAHEAGEAHNGCVTSLSALACDLMPGFTLTCFLPLRAAQQVPLVKQCNIAIAIVIAITKMQLQLPLRCYHKHGHVAGVY